MTTTYINPTALTINGTQGGARAPSDGNISDGPVNHPLFISSFLVSLLVVRLQQGARR